jgi:SAM-dependent methyltransferase
MDAFLWNLRGYIPFTVMWTVRRVFPWNTKSVLDVGCGRGEPMRFLRREAHTLRVGADIFMPYLLEARRSSTHDWYVMCDVRKLPFVTKVFDVVLCLEVLEHLDRDEGVRLLADMERIARKRVIISTPAGRYEQHEYNNNPYQAHKYIWQPSELKGLGYRVIGHGLRWLTGLAGVQSPLPVFLHPLVRAAWVVSGPLSMAFPDLAGGTVCVKEIG